MFWHEEAPAIRTTLTRPSLPLYRVRRKQLASVSARLVKKSLPVALRQHTGTGARRARAQRNRRSKDRAAHRAWVNENAPGGRRPARAESEIERQFNGAAAR